jgi:multiple sugar transport system permease protein
MAQMTATSAASTKRLKGSTWEAISAYLFITPWILGFVLFMGGPILFSLFLSFAHWDGISGLGNIQWAGLDNFREMGMDPRFPKAVYNTFIFTIASVPLSMIGGILVALLMNQKLKGIAFFRTIFYLPSVTAGVASAFLWFFIFQPDYGLLNYSIRLIAQLANFFIHMALPFDIPVKGPQWLADPAWVHSAYVIMTLWGVGASMVIYLAGLQGIPEQLYEAADIDGASTWQQFLNVTLPMLSPVIFFNLILTIIGSFQIFTQAFVLSGGNGSPADAALFYVLYVYEEAFKLFKFGYASALAWLLFVVILIVTLVQFKFSGWVYYEGDLKG